MPNHHLFALSPGISFRRIHSWDMVAHINCVNGEGSLQREAHSSGRDW